jgi:hypothetical protein
MNEALEKHFKDSESWVCDCGEQCNPCDSGWRFNGHGWEHHHGYPIGHVLATKKTFGDLVLENKKLKDEMIALKKARLCAGCDHLEDDNNPPCLYCIRYDRDDRFISTKG